LAIYEAIRIYEEFLASILLPYMQQEWRWWSEESSSVLKTLLLTIPQTILPFWISV
jgi:hypothetical protein